MPDGTVRDTLPAPAPPHRIRGIQSERDGALVPDAYGELPWPMVRAYGKLEGRDYLVRATMRHAMKACMGGECDEFGGCERHGRADEDDPPRSQAVAEASLQIRAIVEEAIRRSESIERDTRLRFIADILDEAAFALGAEERRGPR